MGMRYSENTDEQTARALEQAANEVYRTGIPKKDVGWEITRKDGTKRFIMPQ